MHVSLRYSPGHLAEFLPVVRERRVRRLLRLQWQLHTGHSPERQTAVSETRDLRGGVLIFIQQLSSSQWRCAKNCYRSLRTGGSFATPFLLLWGKSPEAQSM
jgi:hypothetical protein